MKKIIYTTLVVLTSLFTGCGELGTESTEKKAKPTFMFWCFRKEIVSSDYHIPEMKSEKAADYITSRMKGIPGYVKSSHDLETNTMTIDYRSSSIRYMNFEEGIALAGFAVNHRPADPNAKIPEGVK